MFPRAPLGRIVNDLCFLPDNFFQLGEYEYERKQRKPHYWTKRAKK